MRPQSHQPAPAPRRAAADPSVASREIASASIHVRPHSVPIRRLASSVQGAKGSRNSRSWRANAKTSATGSAVPASRTSEPADTLITSAPSGSDEAARGMKTHQAATAPSPATRPANRSQFVTALKRAATRWTYCAVTEKAKSPRTTCPSSPMPRQATV